MSNTKTFRTYGKRPTRTVVTPTCSQPHPPDTHDIPNGAHATPPPSKSVARLAPVAPSKADRAQHPAPALPRRRRQQYSVTPRRRISILSIVSSSRPVVVHRRMSQLAKPPPQTPSPPKNKALMMIGGLSRAQSDVLKEVDVNRINVTDDDDVPPPTRRFRKEKSKGKASASSIKSQRIVLSDDELHSDSASKPRQSRTHEFWNDSDIATPEQHAMSREKPPSLYAIPRVQHAMPAKTKVKNGFHPPDSPTSSTHLQRDRPRTQHVPHLSVPSDDVARYQGSSGTGILGRAQVGPSAINRQQNSDGVPHGPEVQSQSLTPPPLYWRRPPASGWPPQPALRVGSQPTRRDSPAVRRVMGAPVPPVDEILSSFSELSISFTISSFSTPLGSPSAADELPSSLARLLEATHQHEPAEFERFMSDFPMKYYENAPPYRKVGEASFSEVFRVGDIVIKVIPLMSESSIHNQASDEDQSAVSTIEDVLREIVFMSTMGSLQGGSGFAAPLGANVVRGSYPEILLQEWDHWDAQHNSESIRPGCFPQCQLYCIIEMAYSGIDLEKFTFSRATGWAQATSVFWQVAIALSRAEQHLRFEHRDLHWGQVLILPQEDAIKPPGRKPMDDTSHGVAVTIIDFGLSRMDGLSPEDPPLFTNFDEETFEGEGDYQYDIYRMMRTYNEDEWSEFKPMTNLMWLHYLTTKLLKSKGLRKPNAKGKASVTFQNESSSYTRLLEVEENIRLIVTSACKTPRGRSRSTRRAIPYEWGSASDLCEWARSRGWIL